jgi:hypothetical protein
MSEQLDFSQKLRQFDIFGLLLGFFLSNWRKGAILGWFGP